jgi:hypothetical protein
MQRQAYDNLRAFTFAPRVSRAQFGFLVDTYRVKHTVAWELLLLARRCAFVAAKCVRLRIHGAALMRWLPRSIAIGLRYDRATTCAPRARRSPAVGGVRPCDARAGSAAVFGLICLFSLLAQCKTRPL